MNSDPVSDEIDLFSIEYILKRLNVYVDVKLLKCNWVIYLNKRSPNVKYLVSTPRWFS